MKKELEGSLTVYYALIFSVVITFMLALFSYGRILIMKTGVRKDLDLSAFGVMAEYQKEWAEDYGLYMIPESSLCSTYKYYLEKNAKHLSGDYSYDNLIVSPENTLQDPDTLEQQILSFMKERGWLTLMDQIMDLLENAKEDTGEAEKLQEETGGLEGTAALAEIQAVYGKLITLMEGLNANGTTNYYYVNGLWKEDPTWEEVEGILTLMKAEAETMDLSDEEAEFQTITSHEVGELERAWQWLSEVKPLCEQAEEYMWQLAEMMKELEKDDSMENVRAMVPFTSSDMEEYAETMRSNAECCSQAEEAMDDLIQMFSKLPEDMEELTDAIRRFRLIEEYDVSVELPYEYREAASAFDFANLLRQLQGYPDGIAGLAPDEEIDLDLDGAVTSGEPGMALSSLSLGEGFQETYLCSEYILGFFVNFRENIEKKEGIKPTNLRGKEKSDRFLQNEVEYILIGKNNEYENVNGTRQRIVAMRMLLNMSYLLTNPGKRELIESLAASTGGILLPGVGDVVAFAAILSAWSLAESIVDYRTLTEGGEVPFLKTDDSWKTDLSSKAEEMLKVSDEGSGEGGMDYEDYLRVLLYLTSREIKLTRIRDLLQLNHKHYSLADAVTSFRVYGTVIGNSSMDFEGGYGFYNDMEKDEE